MRRQKITFPWQHRLRKIKLYTFEHPTNLAELRRKVETEIDKFYLSFLELSFKNLKPKWEKSWNSILAIGPFLERKKRYSTIPFILIIKKGKIYNHLLKLSEILAIPYLEFGIMPAIYIFSTEMVETYRSEKNINWLRTEAVSIKFSNNFQRNAYT